MDVREGENGRNAMIMIYLVIILATIMSKGRFEIKCRSET